MFVSSFAWLLSLCELQQLQLSLQVHLLYLEKVFFLQVSLQAKLMLLGMLQQTKMTII